MSPVKILQSPLQLGRVHLFNRSAQVLLRCLSDNVVMPPTVSVALNLSIRREPPVSATLAAAIAFCAAGTSLEFDTLKVAAHGVLLAQHLL